MENINETPENSGVIKISDEVIATIASVAVSEVKGVYSLSGTIAGDIAQKLGKKNLNKGIKVSNEDEETTIDISVIVNYGVRIPEIAWEIQENVKKSVESMSGFNVSKVNVHITGVEFDEENSENEE